MKKILPILIFLSIVFVFLTPLAFAETVEFKNPIEYDTLIDLVKGVTDFLYSVALVLAPLFIVIAGYFFVTASGDPKKIETGKNIVLYTLIGLLIIILSHSLVNVVKDALGVE